MYKLILAISTLAALPAGAANRCTASDGTVSFQDMPCTGSTKAEVLKLDPVEPTSARDTLANATIAARQVRTGMTSSEVRRSWGSPTKINTTIGSYGKHEQWVYERANYKNQYLYMENGVLKTVQSPE